MSERASGIDWSMLINDSAPIITIKCTGKHKDRLLTLLESNKSRWRSGKIGRITDDSFDIVTGDMSPFNSKVYTVNPVWGNECFTYLMQLVAEGIIVHSNSPWASPAFFKKKPDATPRLLIDYRKLNSGTTKDRDRPPDITHVLEEVSQKRIFSKFDLNQGYYQMPLKVEAQAKTAFVTQWGCFEFTVMPMGVTNAPAKFQQYMRTRFECDWCKVFVDDIIIFSDTMEEHLEHLKLFFEKCNLYGITLKPSKMVLCTEELEILGHVVRQGVVTPGGDNVRKIMKACIPTTKKHVRGFLGMVGYFRRFVKNFATIAAPLNLLLRDNEPFVWGKAQQDAYELLSEAVASMPELHTPDWNAKFTLETDASEVAISGVLLQNGHAVSFSSRSLTAAERNYTVMDRECLAIIEYTQHYEYYFESTDWEVLTDNAPIKAIFDMVNPRGRHARWLLEFQHLDGRIRFRAGILNVVADYFTRLPPETKSIGAIMVATITPDYQEIQDAQKADLYMTHARRKTPTSTKNPWLMVDMKKHKGLWYLDDRLLIPAVMTEKLVKSWHEAPTMGHTGVNKLYQMMAKHFFWPKMKVTIKTIVTRCLVCQKLRVNPQHMHMHPEIGVEALRMWQIDTAKMPASSENHVVLLSVMDVGTRYPFLIALKNEQALTIAEALLVHVLPFLGVPETVHSDNAEAFTEKLWNAVATLLGIKTRYSPSYAPQGKGIVERSINTAKKKISAAVTTTGPLNGWTHWHETLPYIVWGIRSSPGASGVSPSQALMGVKTMLPQELLDKSGPHPTPLQSTFSAPTIQALNFFKQRLAYVRDAVSERLDNTAVIRAAEAEPLRTPPKFKVGDVVLYATAVTAMNASLGKFNTRFRGPYSIVKTIRDGSTFVLMGTDRKEFTASARQLKASVSLPHEEWPADRNRWDNPKYKERKNLLEKERRKRARE